MRFFKTYFLLLILLTAVPVFGDNSKLDSLITASKNLKNDTNAVLLLNHLSNEYMAIGKNEEARALGFQMITRSERLEFMRGKSLAFHLLGTYYLGENNDSLALDYYHKSLDISKKLNRPSTIAASLLQISSVYSNKGQFTDALITLNEAHSFATLVNDSIKYVYIFVNKSEVYSQLNNPEKALECLQLALKICTLNKNQNLLGNILGGLGKLLTENGYKKEGLSKYREATAWAKKNNNIYIEALTLGNTASLVYELEKDFKKAMALHFYSLELFQKLNNTSQIARTTLNIGDLYLKNRDYALGLEWLLKGHDLLVAINDKYGSSLAKIKIAQEYIRIGKIAESLKFANGGLQAALGLKSLSLEMQANAILYKIFSKKGDYKAAITYLERKTFLAESLNSEKEKNDLKLLKSKQELEQLELTLKTESETEKQRLLLKAKEYQMVQESKHNRQILISIFIGILLIVVLVFSVFLWKRFKIIGRQKAVIEKQKELVDEKQKEILDSIKYAKRIQQSLLPTETFITKNISRLSEKDKSA